MKKILSLNFITFYLLVISSIFIAFWLKNTPPTLLLNWDIYEHQTLINNILNGKISFINSKISDTFTVDGYTPLYHIINAVIQKVLGFDSTNSAYYWYFIQIIYYGTTILGSFFVSIAFTKSKKIAFLTAIFGALIFESYVAYTSLFLIPQTLTSLIFVFTVFYVVKCLNTNQKINKIALIIFVITMLLMHFIIGFIAIVTLIFIYVNLKYSNNKINNILILSVFVSLILIIVFNKYLIFNPLKTQESIDFNVSLMEKVFHFKNWYGYLTIFLVPLGTIYSLYKNDKNLKLVSILALGFLAIGLFPFPYTLKFYVLGRYFVNILLSLGVYYFVDKTKTVKGSFLVITIFLTLSLFYIAYFNLSWYKNLNKYNNTYSHYSAKELQTAKFLKNVYSKETGVLLVSDPSTQYILEAFSGINTQGGAYANIYTRKALINLNQSKETQFIKRQLFNIKDTTDTTPVTKVLWALSGRYFEWQTLKNADKYKFSVNIWSPKTLLDTDKEYIEGIKKDINFNEIYRNEELVILEVK